MIKEILNLSDRDTKQKLLVRIGALQGPHRVEIARARRGRSGQANRYYFGCVVKGFGHYLRDQGNSHLSDEMAHEIFKAMFLRTTVVNEMTGAELSFTGSSADLNTEQFSEYVEKCIAFLATDCNVTVQPAEAFA